jgi:capsule synthesis protein PGA_cap
VIAALLLAFACDTVRVCAGGDVTLGTNLDSTWGRIAGVKKGDWRAKLMPPDSLVAQVAPFYAGADIVLFNAEGAFGDDSVADDKCTVLAKRHHLPKPKKGAKPVPSNCFELRQPAAAATALRRLGDSAVVVVANVANNHAHDAGDDGFVHSVQLLRDAGLVVTGADTVPSVVVTRRGDTVAILGFSAWSSPGVDDLAAVERLVAAARARYGRVIVTAHMGAEGALAQRTGDSVEHFVGEDRGNPVAFAHAVIDSGASLVIGHGPHVLRAAEWRDSAVVFYSLGNLINYGPFNLAEPRNRGAVVCATLDSAGALRDVVIRPTLQVTHGVVRPDSSGRASALLDSLSRLDFSSTGVTVDSTGAVRRQATVSPVPPDSTSSPRPSEPDVPPATASRAARSAGRARSR